MARATFTDRRYSLGELRLGDEERAAIAAVVDAQWLTMGPVTQRFEARLAETLGVERALAVSSCTAALHLAYLALGIGPGDEVIVPSLTFVATVNAVRYCGATPVFADILGPHNLTIDPEDVARCITPATRAIVAVHHSGYPARLEALQALARAHGLYLVEDAAHAPGSYLDGRPLGTFGDAGCYSFFSNKNMTTGEGGCLVMPDTAHFERARLLRSHGMTTLTWDRHRGHASSYDVVDLGFNYRIDELRSAIGIVQLDRLQGWNQRRAALVQCYREHLLGLPQVEVPFAEHAGTLAYHLMPVLLPDQATRDRLVQQLPQCGVQVSVHYTPAHTFTAYRELGSRRPLPRTEGVGARLLTLPLHPHLEASDVAEIVRRLEHCLRSAGQLAEA